jgi:SSS family solute:Na+ symporter
MFAGFALIFPFAIARVGGPAALVARLPPGHLSWTGGMGPGRLIAWWLIAVWTIVDPAFHQRCAAAESPSAARRGILLSIGFWMVSDLMTTAAGLYARAALPSLDAPLMAFPLLADALLPRLARGVFFAGIASSVFAALQSKTLLGAISLGRDLSERAGAGTRVRAGLVASAALGLLLARLLPSVVELWYAIGSAAIPGLLLPMLGVYIPRLRIDGRWAAAASVAGFSVSLAWVVGGAHGASLWGVEPPFPGLLVSAAIWAAGKAFGRMSPANP